MAKLQNNLSIWAETYKQHGLYVFPVSMPEKNPAVPYKTSWTPLNKEGKIVASDRWVYRDGDRDGVGIACGSLSDNVEVIDFDTKHTTKDLMTDYFDAGDDQLRQIYKKLTVQTTVSGGYHFVYRCDVIGGNQQLAIGAESKKAIIETRGEGGYIVSAPTWGYKLIQGSLTDIPRITPDERDVLISTARLLNEEWKIVSVPRKSTAQSHTGLTPWEDYDKRGFIPELLEKHGWEYVRKSGENDYYRRPGKDSGISSSWNESLRMFYVFTSSTCFEGMKAYRPSVVHAYLECNGDFTESAKKLYSDGYGDRYTTTTTEVIPEPLPERDPLRMTFKYVKKNLHPAIRFNGVIGVYPGELFALVGLPGQGKSAVCEGITTAYLSGTEVFGFSVHSTGKKILCIDTERPTDNVSDSYNNIAKRLVTPKLDADGEIDRLVYLTLSEFGKVEQLKAILERELSTDEFEALILDGILDFSKSMNDDIDSTEVVKWVRSLAVKHNCAVMLTIHPNKGSEVIAGHLGAFLYRWCRAILFIRSTADDKSVKEITSEPDMAKLSHGDKATLQPVYFAWDESYRMLMRCDYTPAKERGQADKMRDVFSIVFRDNRRYRHKELKQEIMKLGHSDSTAKRWITKGIDDGILDNASGIYSVTIEGSGSGSV